MNAGQQPRLSTHESLRLWSVGSRIAAFGVLMFAAAHARAEAVVTNQVVSQATQTQTSVPVTFGQVFKAGDVPRGATVTATLDGQPAPLQVDAKATNPDGSLRHAVLTVLVPALPGRTDIPLVLTAEPPLPPGKSPITTSRLLATAYDTWVSLDLGGKIYTANARALLQAASDDKACAPWGTQCNVWLSGPLVSEWVVNGPVTAADGTTDPSLRIYFAIRAYAGTTPGTVGYVRTDVIVENSSAFAPQAQPQYTATLTSGTATYTSPALTQYAYTRWHKQLWWNYAEPQVYLQQDTQYIQASKAVSRYMPLTPDEKFLASLRQSCAPLDHCDQTQAMATTGAQASIGPLPRWSSVYIVHPDVRAYNWMLANTDALGAYSSHYRDAQTGLPVSIQKHPYVTVINWSGANQVAAQTGTRGAAYKADTLQNCTNNSVVSKCSTAWYGTGNPNVWDNAHQPSGAYLPYMVTGDYYYMSELAFGASYNEIWSSEAYRGYSKGLIDGSHGQVRGKAWVLREMADAAYLLPDSHPLQAEFTTDVENSLADWNAKYTDNPSANPLGLMNAGTVYSLNGGNGNGMAPWQHNFLTWSASHAADLGFGGAAEFRNWLAKFEIGLMTDWQTNPTRGYCWLQAAAYSIQVKDSSGAWLPSYTAVYGMNWPTLTTLECNSPAMLAELGKLRNKSAQPGEMSGYPYSATGYPANFQIGLAAAADSGLPNAQAAWNIFESRSVKPTAPDAYDNYPNFAVIPRSSSPSTVAPVQPVNPVPPDDPLVPHDPVAESTPAAPLGSVASGNTIPPNVSEPVSGPQPPTMTTAPVQLLPPSVPPVSPAPSNASGPQPNTQAPPITSLPALNVQATARQGNGSAPVPPTPVAAAPRSSGKGVFSRFFSALSSIFSGLFSSGGSAHASPPPASEPNPRPAAETTLPVLQGSFIPVALPASGSSSRQPDKDPGCEDSSNSLLTKFGCILQ